MKFIHLSDLHIKLDDDAIENKNIGKLTEFIIDEYKDFEHKPVILITGDLVDNGYAEEYRNVKRELQLFIDEGFKLLICPGNHDCGVNGWNYSSEAYDRFYTEIDRGLLGNKSKATGMVSLFPQITEFKNDKVVFVGVDSLAGKIDKPKKQFYAVGKAGTKQINEIKSVLNKTEYDDFKKIIYLHHHPWSVSSGHLMSDHEDFVNAIKDHADMVCFGHKHNFQFWAAKDDQLAGMNAGASTSPSLDDNGKDHLVFLEMDTNDLSTYTLRNKQILNNLN